MTQEYVLYLANSHTDYTTQTCVTGGQLYETLYELEPFDSNLLNFNTVSMFQLECLVQKLKRIELECNDYSTIIIWFFPDNKEKFPVPDLTFEQDDYECIEYADNLHYFGDCWCEHSLDKGWEPIDCCENDYARLRKAFAPIANSLTPC